MHGLPTIVVMNMSEEQRKAYNLQEGVRLQARRERDAAYRVACQSRIKFWTIVAVLAAVATIAFKIV